MDRRWHRPSWTAYAMTAFGVAAFGALGSWQLDRATQKERLFAAFEGAAAQTPVTLDAARHAGDPLPYPLVRVRGTFDATHAYELVDQTHEGAVGTVAWAIFAPSDGSTPLLVDRGFVAPKTPGGTPDVPPLPQDAQEITALYAPPPGSGLRLGGNPLPRQTHWPKQSIYLDVGEIAADTGRKLDPKVLLLAPDATSGFVRDWKPNVFPPERHRGYAFTWFTLAAVVVVAFVTMHWRKDEMR